MRTDSGYRARGGALAAVALLALFAVLAACGSASTPSASPPASSSPLASSPAPSSGCADVAALKTAVDQLTQVKPLQDGLTALQTAIANVKTSLDAATASASAALQPAVAQVKTAFDALQSAASGLAKGNLVAKAPSISAALSQLGTAVKGLDTTLTQTCPA